MVPLNPILADVAGVVAVADRTEMRTRSPGAVSGRSSIDVETAQTVRVLLFDHPVTYTFGYAARLNALDASVLPFAPSFFQTGSGRVEWHKPKTSVWVSQGLDYRQFSSAGPTTPATFGSSTARDERQPDARRQRPIGLQWKSGGRVGNADPDGAERDDRPAEQRAGGPRTFRDIVGHSAGTMGKASMILNASYLLNGGATRDERASLPLQKGPRGDGTLGYSRNHRERFYVASTAQRIDFEDGPANVIIDARAGWNRMLSRRLSFDVSAGASSWQSRLDPTAKVTRGLNPSGRTSLSFAPTVRATHFVFAPSAGIAPTVDRLLGSVDQRADAQIVASATRRRVATHLGIGYATSLDRSAPNSLQFFFGEWGATWSPWRPISLDGGVRVGFQGETSGAALQRGQPVPVPDTTQSSIYLAPTVRSPDLHF